MLRSAREHDGLLSAPDGFRDLRHFTAEDGMLRWAVGCFCVIMGTLMLVAPHQFSSPLYGVLRDGLPFWAALFVLAGGALIGVSVLRPGRTSLALAHVAAGGVLLYLAYSFARGGGWSALAVYSALGLGTVFAPFISPRPTAERPVGDFLAVLIGVGAVFNGIIMMALPSQLAAPAYDLIRPYALWYGGAFVAAGVFLVSVHIVPPRRRTVEWAAHLFAAGVLIAFMLAGAAPYRIWTGVAYYGGFGIVLAVMPWLRRRIRHLDLASLRVRFAFVLSATVALALILVLAITTELEERQATEQELEEQMILASMVAQDIADVVGLHLGTVATLAAYPGLLDLPPEAQRSLLLAAKREHLNPGHLQYPDGVAFLTIDAAGRAIARSDDNPLISYADNPMFQRVRDERRPVVDVVPSVILGRPVLAFGAPIYSRDGQFLGEIGGSLDSAYVATRLRTMTGKTRPQVYLVDARGRAVAHPDAAVVSAFSDLSDRPPVAALLHGASDVGTLRYGEGDGRRLAAYARVPQFGWGVVVERHPSAALVGARSGREVAFVLMLLAIAGAAAIGAVVAGWLVSPLANLSEAAIRLAGGERTTPLPRSNMTEVARLSAAFGEMRERLTQRDEERLLLLDRERAAHAEAEAERKRFAFLAEVGRELASSLDYETTIQQVARLVVPALADWCTVDILAEDVPMRLAVAHSDPDKEALVRELRERYPPSPDGPSPASRALRAGQSVLYGGFTDESLPETTRDAEHLRIITALAPKSAIAVPLAARGRTIGLLTLATSISTRRYSQADLALAEDLARRCALAVDNALLYREAQEAVRARDEFLSVAAHELKTPVTSLKGFAQLLIRRLDRSTVADPRQVREAMRAIDSQADRLAHLVAQLLDVSRIQSGRLALEQAPTELVAFVAGIVETARSRTDRHTITVEAPDTLVAAVDSLRLEQVLTNLLDNAIKYSPDGGAIEVALGEARDGRIRLAVRDHGLGIPVEHRAQIFDRFYQAHGTHHLGGLGLGLYISRQIVELHGGTIAAEFPDGGGTRFVVTLPPGERIGPMSKAIQSGAAQR